MYTQRRGRGLFGDIVNKAIDILPFELHIPGYQYCGPGTNLSKRLKRGDVGINKLDSACKIHDIAYNKYSDSKNRAIADKELAERAWERVNAKDSSLGEKSVAWAVTNIMKAKNKFGGGSKKRKNKNNSTTKIKKMLETIKKKVTHLEGKGLYVRPYRGSGQTVKKKKKRSTRRK